VGWAIKPLEDIENEHGMRSVGALAVQIYRGACDETDDPNEALFATVAALAAMFAQPKPEEEQQ
jgi:hypothetical protein